MIICLTKNVQKYIHYYSARQTVIKIQFIHIQFKEIAKSLIFQIQKMKWLACAFTSSV